MTDVIVGVDESAGAAGALRWATTEATLHGWDVTAVMAWGLLDQHHPDADQAFDPEYSEDDAAATLAVIVERALGAEGAKVGTRVINDLPAPALLDAATGSRLLVVGARGLGGFRGLLLGSVSQHCLHHASSPIAVVHHAERLGGARRVVVAAVDGSDTSTRALAWAIEEARLRRITLRVVTAWHLPVVGSYPYAGEMFDPPLFERGARQVVDDALAACNTEDVGLEQIVGEGSAANVILEAAKAADLVVMGSRGLGGFKGLLVGSATQQVTHHAPCPVIVVPPAA